MNNEEFLSVTVNKALPGQENLDEKEVWHKHHHIPLPAETSLHTWKKNKIIWS